MYLVVYASYCYDCIRLRYINTYYKDDVYSSNNVSLVYTSYCYDR